MFIKSRRNFLKGTAATIAGAVVAKGVFSTIVKTPAMADGSRFTNTPKSLQFYPPLEQWDDFKELDGDDWKRGGIDRKGVESKDNLDGIKVNDYIIVPTVCSNCEAGCGLTAWVDKKSLVVKKYMGNPLHSASRGRNCAKGYATWSQMYDPDRVPFPLKRAPGSKRGEGKWIRVTWDDAMKDIGKKLSDMLKKGDEISKKMFIYHVGRPNENGFGARIPHTLGVDGYDSHTNICSAGARQGSIQWANDDRNSPDWANAKLIFLQSSHAADAGHYYQQSAGYIADARKRGAKMVVIDPRLSNSAGMADLWIPAWPGTEAALYLYLANRILNEKDKNGDDLVDHEFVKNWLNWKKLLKDKDYLRLMVDRGYISKMPKDESYESFIEMLKELYSPYDLDFVVKECRLEGQEYKLEKLFEMVIDAEDKIATYFWRAGTIGNRGGWMNTRTGFLVLALRGALRGDIGGTSWHHWHKASVNGKWFDATMSNGKKPQKVDVWNEYPWPPEYPLATYELSYILPHLLMDEKWKRKWRSKGFNIPDRLAVWIPRMYNPVWINPDGFRWIECLKREDLMELTLNLSPTWSETNWYCDYVLPTGLAGERHDQQSEPSKPEKWVAFRQPALRVALEKMGWKPKDPTRATLEAHMKAGLGEVWEEIEFWANLIVRYVDPDGKLGIKKYWISKEDPSRPITIAEFYQAAFSLLPNLKKAAKAAYPNSKYPCYEFMRDRGAFTEEANIFKPQEEEIKFDGNYYYAHGHKISKDDVIKDEGGVLWIEHNGHKKSIGVEIDGKIYQGFHTPDKRLDFFVDWLKEYRWAEYAIPIYPRNKKEREEMIHLVTQVHHDYIKAKNQFVLNTIYRLPYNIHTRSVNSKHLMEISVNHNPIWIHTSDANRLGIKKGDKIRVRIVDTLSGLESGYFVAMAVPTEATRPGVLACSHHAGRWKLKNAVEIPGFEHKLGIMGVGAPLYELKIDGKIGKMRAKEGIDKGIKKREDSWQFKEINKDLDNIWWDGLTGAWQNAVAPVHPDPISGHHAWQQMVIIEKAKKEDEFGDVYVNYENNFKTYQVWRDKLTRPLNENIKYRRPRHIPRPAVPLSEKAYLNPMYKGNKET